MPHIRNDSWLACLAGRRVPWRSSSTRSTSPAVVEIVRGKRELLKKTGASATPSVILNIRESTTLNLAPVLGSIQATVNVLSDTGQAG